MSPGATCPRVSEPVRTRTNADCRIVAVVNSVQEFWDASSSAGAPRTNSRSRRSHGQTNTAAAAPSLGSRPFLLPTKPGCTCDLSFFEHLRATSVPRAARSPSRTGGTRLRPHVQNLLGLLTQEGAASVPGSNAVRARTPQADCSPASGAPRHGDLHDRATDRGRHRDGPGCGCRRRRRPIHVALPGRGATRELDARFRCPTAAVVPRGLQYWRHGALRHVQRGPRYVIGES